MHGARTVPQFALYHTPCGVTRCIELIGSLWLSGALRGGCSATRRDGVRSLARDVGRDDVLTLGARSRSLSWYVANLRVLCTTELQEDLEASVSEDSDSSSSSDEDAPRAAQRPAKKPRVDLATLEEQAADDGEEEVILLASDSSDDDGGAARAPPVRRLPVEAQNPKMQRLMQGKLRAQRRQLARKMKEKQEKRKREEVANRAAAEKLRVMKESNAGGDDLDALLANGGAGSGGGAGTGAGRGESLEFSVRSKSRSDPVSVTVWSVCLPSFLTCAAYAARCGLCNCC